MSEATRAFRPLESQKLTDPARARISDYTPITVAHSPQRGFYGSTPPSGLRLQRKCACGGTPEADGECAECRKKRLQAKLIVGATNDPMEQEADRVAEQVTGSAAHVASAGVPPRIQRVATSDGGSEQTAPASVDRALAESGSPMNPALRQEMEGRFGQDFSGVRVHTGSTAEASAREVQALAYTVGSHVVFGNGRYAPASASGRKLIAHELTHVVQQSGDVLRRTPDPDAQKDFDDRIAALRKNPAFLAVEKNPDPALNTKKEVEEIITAARGRDDVSYYIGKLELLFNTPDEKPEKQAAAFSGGVSTAAGDEAARLATPQGTARAGVEEAAAKDAARVWTKAKGESGTLFLIDARNVADIAVRLKVQLVPKGKGKKEDVEHVAGLEDAIEKNASTFGYNMDLEFVDKPSKDVFTVGVDPSGWPTSGNWIAGPQGLAHELHHLLGLDDLYNYIEAHAGNALMKMPERIHWFRKQMDKTPDPGMGQSIMGRSTTGARNLPSDRDVCRVAGAAHADGSPSADFDDCLKKREDARRAALQPGLSAASVIAYRAHQLLTNIKPLSPGEDPKLRELKVRHANVMAENIFGKPVSMSDVTDAVRDMQYALALPNLFLVSELSAKCTRTAFTAAMAPRIRLCPAFLSLSAAGQADLLLREASHMAGVTNGTADAPCPAAGCADACGDSNNGEAWVRFTKCVAAL